MVSLQTLINRRLCAIHYRAPRRHKEANYMPESALFCQRLQLYLCVALSGAAALTPYLWLGMWRAQPG